MRVFVLSHRYLDPARRGKLEALTAFGAEVRVAVPEHWEDRTYGRRHTTAWERIGRLEIAPVRVSRAGSVGDARWRRSDVQRLLRDFRPDVIHIDEEPTARAAATIARSARDGLAIPPASANVARQPCTVGFVGRLVPERGLDVLFRALEAVPVHHWRLAIVGDGPERERLEALARQVHLPARLRWLGALSGDELRAAWLGFDVVVVPSRASHAWADPTGSVAVEAMAHGIPVVVTTSGALPDVVGEAGIVVPEGDHDAMRAALAELVADPARREALGAAGRARAIDRYSDHALARGLLAFWDGVVRQ